jgi:hypothetical protein
MVDLNGKDVSNAIGRLLKEIEDNPEMHMDLLFHIGSIIISVGIVKNIPTLTVIGKNLFLIPDRFRYWFLGRHGIYGATDEVRKLFNEVNKYFDELLKSIKEISKLIETKEEISDNDFTKQLDVVDHIVTILRMPAETLG